MKADICIDGLNVCMWKRGEISLLILICLLNLLLERKCSFHCFFDAVTLYRLSSDLEKDIYNELINNYQNFFSEITGGIEADEFILECANTMKALVISNDRYRDFWDKFKWLNSKDTKESRLIKGSVIINNLVIPQLAIDVSIVGDLPSEIFKLRKRLDITKARTNTVVFPPKNEAKKVISLLELETDSGKRFYPSDSEATVIRENRKFVFIIKGENDFKRRYFANTIIDKNELRGSKINEIRKETSGKIIEIKFVNSAIFLISLTDNLKIHLNNKLLKNKQENKLKHGLNRLKIEEINFEINIERL